MPETHVIYTVGISDEHLRVIGAALNEMPYRIAAPVLTALQAQVTAIDKRRADDAKAMEAAQQGAENHKLGGVDRGAGPPEPIASREAAE